MQLFLYSSHQSLTSLRLGLVGAMISMRLFQSSWSYWHWVEYKGLLVNWNIFNPSRTCLGNSSSCFHSKIAKAVSIVRPKIRQSKLKSLAFVRTKQALWPKLPETTSKSRQGLVLLGLNYSFSTRPELLNSSSGQMNVKVH